jgi:hypothetical protein
LRYLSQSILLSSQPSTPKAGKAHVNTSTCATLNTLLQSLSRSLLAEHLLVRLG